MKKIFIDLTYEDLYERCIMASVAHAIMVGKYDLLSAEQSWDGVNYNFQNLEGVRGVISFSNERYICFIQNHTMYETYTESHISKMLNGAEKEIVDLAKNEALQYMLINHKEYVYPFVSATFWGNKKVNFSNYSEEKIIRISEDTIMPFLYNEKDAKRYWEKYYEMTDEQIELVESICKRRTQKKGKIRLEKKEVDKLKEWFEDITECIESFNELEIYLD